MSSAPNIDDGGLQRLAYELSLRALGQQESTLNDLRARTGTLLAASSLVSSFLGARAVDRGGVTWLAVPALIAFAGSVIASLFILLPKSQVIFALRGSVLFEEEFTDPGGLAETHRRLAYWLEQYRDANQPTVERLFGFYRAAAFALLIEVVLWSIELALG